MRRNLLICRFPLAVVILFAAYGRVAQAQGPSTADSLTNLLEADFRPGWHEASFGAGALFSNVVRTDNRPNIDYAMSYAEAGYTVLSPGGGGIFRGSLELAPEIFGAGVFHGPGHYVAGGTLWLRYNFVQPGSRFVPYLEGGGGGTALDIPDKFDGKIFNWNLDAALGLRYFLTPRISLNAEYRLQHISNADMWSHNVGVNTSGGFLGVSLFF